MTYKSNEDLGGGMSWVNLVDLVYPIGSYFISNEETNPAEMFGGEWTEVTGRFLYANSGIDTGGSNTTSHYHYTLSGTSGSEPLIYFANGEITHTRVVRSGYGTYVTNEAAKAAIQRRESGTYDTSLDNMPAYREVYAWYRVA